MSRALATLLSLFVLLATAAPIAAKDPHPESGAVEKAGGLQTASADAGAVLPGQVVVGWRDAKAGPERARGRGLRVMESIGAPARAQAVISTEGRPVADVLAELRTDPAVAFAEPDYQVALAEDPSPAPAADGEVTALTGVAVNDPQTANQYSLSQMRVRDAWSRTTGGTGKVAVLDTGVQSTHPDLSGRVVAGYDFVNNDSNAADDNGHGTWVAGIIAANANDAYGIAGVSWSDKIIPVKIMGREGTGSTSDLASGIVWAADHGATVINMSVGGFPYSQYIQDAVTYAWNKGAVLVGAAGNNQREETFYPASYANVVSVSATQVNGEFSNWSSWGPKVDVSAPGSSVLTTNCTACTYADHHTWGSHTYISGTSFATPNVAGVVALIRAKYPTYTPQQVVARLTSTVDDVGMPGWDSKYGNGRVNALRATGGWSSTPGPSMGDALEPNNSAGAIATIPLGSASSPTLHPAGDVDWFAVDVPRAGRLDVRVTGVVDTRAYPWNKSGLPVDPIVELYTAAGALIKRVDAVWESGTELAATSVAGPARVLVRVSNWYANGNRTAYTITPTYVDTVIPTAALANPTSGATGVSRFVNPSVRFSERVTGVSGSTVRLRDLTTSELVPAKVTYDAASRSAVASPTPTRLAPARAYQVEVTTGVADLAGNAVAAGTWTFTTGTASFTDTAGTSFETEIEWLLRAGITSGCTAQAFCPSSVVRRNAMASFISRAVDLPGATRDYFTDDEDDIHEGTINRLAAARVTGGCSATRFCPTGVVTRAQMASFLARALGLPSTSVDPFDDDEASAHEADINRLAAAGIVFGCDEDSYCPNSIVTREQMAAFLYRAFREG